MSIHPNDYNLKQVLSESGDLYVPWFQRNYTWDEDNVDELFQDIFDEYSWENLVESARNRTPLRDYFMGAVMLCGPCRRPHDPGRSAAPHDVDDASGLGPEEDEPAPRVGRLACPRREYPP